MNEIVACSELKCKINLTSERDGPTLMNDHCLLLAASFVPRNGNAYYTENVERLHNVN